MTAYYNENDRFAAAWLRELIKAGAIAPGDVDERSILDVSPNDLKAYTQCHFFAGIGVWSHALRNAGWDDNRPVWTGSCPCQPFSAAGAGAGFADERHLWPAFHYLIQECGPGVVFGEQVASKDGRTWLDHVQTDMENLGFAIGASDICAAGFGAPHIRQRLYFVAERVGDTSEPGLPAFECAAVEPERRGEEGRAVKQRSSALGGLADSKLSGTARLREYGGEIKTEKRIRDGSTDSSQSDWLADTECQQRERRGAGETVSTPGSKQRTERLCDAVTGESTTGPTNGFWRDTDWLFCRDGKWRPVRPGTSPLVAGAAKRVGRLRGYGNAINAEAAKAFIESYVGK